VGGYSKKQLGEGFGEGGRQVSGGREVRREKERGREADVVR
jgi:hypothetical protein